MPHASLLEYNPTLFNQTVSIVKTFRAAIISVNKNVAS